MQTLPVPAPDGLSSSLLFSSADLPSQEATASALKQLPFKCLGGVWSPSPPLCPPPRPLPAAPRAGEPTERPGTEESPQPHGGTRGEGPGRTPGSCPCPPASSRPRRCPPVTHRAPAPPPPAATPPAPAGPFRETEGDTSRQPAPSRRGTAGSSAPSSARTGAGPAAPPAGAERRDAGGPPPRPAPPPGGLPCLPRSPGRAGAGERGRWQAVPAAGAMRRAGQSGGTRRYREERGGSPPAPAPLPGPSARSFPFAVSSGCCCDRRDCPEGRRGAPGRGAAAWGAGGEGSRAGSQGTVLSQQFGSGHVLGRREMGEMMLHTWLLNPQGLNRAGGSGAGSFV